jgi:hypothetical protein
MFGKSSAAKEPAPAERVWPDAGPPGEFGHGGLNINGTSYRAKEVEPGKWQWVVNTESMDRMADLDTRRRNLYWALRSRLLTDEEMAQVASWGSSLNIDSGVCYSADEKARELNDALLQQFRFRAIQQQVERGAVSPNQPAQGPATPA